MKKKLRLNQNGYDISVKDFTDWIEALEEIEIARLKIRAVEMVSPVLPLSILETQSFPSWFTRKMDLIIFSLLIKYPNGMTKEELTMLTGMKETSLLTLLTSKEKNLAEHLAKNDNNEYSLLRTSLHWAVNELVLQKDK